MDNGLYCDLMNRINELSMSLMKVENADCDVVTVKCNSEIPARRFVSFQNGTLGIEGGNLLGASVTGNHPSYNTGVLQDIIQNGFEPEDLYQSVRKKLSESSQVFMEKVEKDYEKYRNQEIQVKFRGIVEVFDNGKCEVGEFCISREGLASPMKSGLITASPLIRKFDELNIMDETFQEDEVFCKKFLVIERVNDNVIRVLL